MSSTNYFVLPMEKLLYSYKGVINFISLNGSVSFAKNDDLLLRQHLYFQWALKSFIVKKEIKLIRSLKNRGGEEMHKELGVIYPEPEKADEGHSKNDQLYVKQCG